MKLRSKMLYLYIGINIIIFLAVGIYLMTSYKASKFEGIKDEYMSQLKHLEFSLSSFFESTENELRTLESIDLVRNEEDFEFTSYLNADPETFVLNPGPEEAEIVKILNAFRTENEYVNSVYMGRANGAFVRSHPRGKNTKYDPRERPWYQLALEDPKRIMITDPYKSVTTEDLNIGFVKALVNEPGNVYGVVGMDVTLSNLTEYFRNVDVSRSGWITLWDSKGTMLVTNNPEHMMKNYLEVSDNESVYNGIMNSKSGYTKPHETMNSTYGFYYTVGEIGWKIFITIPEKELDKDIRKLMYDVLILISGGLIILAFATYRAMSKYVLEPVERLGKGAKHIIDTGELNYSFIIGEMDEIGHLADTFNQMMRTISSSQDQLKESENELREHKNQLETLVEERTREISKLDQAVEQSPSSVFITNADGIIEYVNKQFTVLTGFEKEEAIGNSANLIRSELNDDEIYEKLRNSINDGDKWDCELINRRKDQSEFWSHLFISPIFNEEQQITHFCAVLYDITARKEADAELELAKKKAEEATEAKSQFLANMSHEIRTPMNAVLGLTHLSLKTKLDQKQRGYLKKIDSASRALLRIINDILDFSKIEAGKLDVESIDFCLDNVIDNVSNLLTFKALDKGIEFLTSVDPEIPMDLVGDPLRMEQIFINIINNAIKFTDKGEVLLEAKLIDKTSDKVRVKFNVKDTGIGISKEHKDKLFKPFTQADGTITRKFGGTGLGLTITKHLVEMMNGFISVESELGKGSTFTFDVLFEYRAELAKERIIPKLDIKGMRTLVIDDSLSARIILKDVLESFDFKVDEVENLEKAKGALEIHWLDYDLIIIDCFQRNYDKQIFAELLNSYYATEKPKIIGCGPLGFEIEEILEESLQYDSVFFKPFTPSSVFEALMEALAEKGDYAERLNFKIKDSTYIFDGIKVLLVEDNEINQMVAQELLEQVGIEVMIADNGKTAVEMIDDSYDVVLMDVQMPILDGYQATKIIRENPRYESKPIIAMTANAMPRDERKALESGMDDYLSKPIEPDLLLSKIAKWTNVDASISTTIKGAESIIEVDDVIDFEEGLLRIGGNRNLYVKLLNRFKNNYSSAKEEMLNLISNENQEVRQRYAHSLKGVAGNIAAHKVQGIAADLEEALKHNQVEKAESYLERFHQALNETFAKISLYLETVEVIVEEVEKVVPNSDETINELIVELFESLKKRKPKEIEVIFKKLDNHKMPDGFLEDYNEIKTLSSKYKYKDAYNLLSDIVDKLEI